MRLQMDQLGFCIRIVGVSRPPRQTTLLVETWSLVYLCLGWELLILEKVSRETGDRSLKCYHLKRVTKTH